MSDFIPLSILRIWCRKKESWLSFKTSAGDRFFLGSRGYFIELPDGDLEEISPRLVFPVENHLPVLNFHSLAIQEKYGSSAVFVAVPENESQGSTPFTVSLSDIAAPVDKILPFTRKLDSLERYIVLRLYESGMVSAERLKELLEQRNEANTLCRLLIDSASPNWEQILGACLDTRCPQLFDPPSLKKSARVLRWELTGELLFAMDHINRTQLEHALKLKRDGDRALGEILVSMGSCTHEDIEAGLELQHEARQEFLSQLGLIGEILISQGVISKEQLDEALKEQKVGRQPLEKILLSMDTCTIDDIKTFIRENDWQGFQSTIDDCKLGEWMVRTGRLNRQQLDEAMRLQARGRQVLGELLLTLQLATQEQLLKALKEQQQIRDNYKATIEKLGMILVSRGKVADEDLRKALDLQSLARQPIGCVLVATGATTPEAVQEALTIQDRWRSRTTEQDETRTSPSGDRLGEVLMRKGVVTHSEINKALARHMQSGHPIGESLIDLRLCSPESIIEVLLDQESERRRKFKEFLEGELKRLRPQPLEPGVEGKIKEGSPAKTRKTDESVLQRLASILFHQ